MRSKWRPSSTVFRVYGFPHLFPNLKGYDRAVAAARGTVAGIQWCRKTLEPLLAGFVLAPPRSLRFLQQIFSGVIRLVGVRRTSHWLTFRSIWGTFASIPRRLK